MVRPRRPLTPGTALFRVQKFPAEGPPTCDTADVATSQRGDDEPDRDETPAERLDRNWNELLQELRVTQTGVQIIFAFLLILPFQDRFSDLTTVQRWIFIVVVALITISTILNLAPVIAHRFVFRKHKKGALLGASDAMAKAAFVTLGVALVGVVGLVVEVVMGPVSAAVIVIILVIIIVALWLVLPRWLLTRSGGANDIPE